VKLRILDLAEADLLNGYQFYESQSSGIGSYFFETLYSDIESLRLYAGIHRQLFGFHRLLSRRFPFASITRSMTAISKSGACLIAGAIPAGFVTNCERAADGRVEPPPSP